MRRNLKPVRAPMIETTVAPRKATAHPRAMDRLDERNNSLFHHSFGVTLLAYCLVKGSPIAIVAQVMRARPP